MRLTSVKMNFSPLAFSILVFVLLTAFVDPPTPKGKLRESTPTINSLSMKFSLLAVSIFVIGMSTLTTSVDASSCSGYNDQNSCLADVNNCGWCAGNGFSCCVSATYQGAACTCSGSGTCGVGCIIGTLFGVFMIIGCVSFCCYRARQRRMVYIAQAPPAQYAYVQPTATGVVTAVPVGGQAYLVQQGQQPQYAYGTTSGYTAYN
jgi:hypothetical protein